MTAFDLVVVVVISNVVQNAVLEEDGYLSVILRRPVSP